MAENNDKNTQTPKQKKLENIQIRRFLKQERENKELKKQLTTLLNYQKQLDKKADLTNKSMERDAEIRAEIRKNNKAINSILNENKKYVKAMKEAQATQDEENVKFYKDALKDNDIEIKRLKQLNKDIKEGNKKIEDSLDDVNDNLEQLDKTFSSSFDDFRDILDSFNIMELKDSVEANTDEVAQSRKEILDSQNLSREERVQLNKDINTSLKELNKTYGNAFNSDDMNEAMQAMFDAGLKKEDVTLLIDEVVKLRTGLGLDIDNATNIMTYSSEKSLDALGDTFTSIKDWRYVDTDAIIDSLDQMMPSFSQFDEATQIQMQRDVVTAIATMQNQNMGTASEQFADIVSDTLNEQSMGNMQRVE